MGGSIVTSSPTSNHTLPDRGHDHDDIGELFAWHGTELVFIPLMMVLGIVGNLVVFYIYHFRWRSDTVTLVKRMLAGLDLAFLLLAMPIILHLAIHPNTSVFVPICRFSSFVALTSAVASGFVLVIIAVDRFVKLRLLQKKGVSGTQSKHLFIAGLVVGIIINIPTCWIFGRDSISFHDYHVVVSYCFIDKHKDETLFAVWASMVAVVFVVITVTLVILYAMIIRTLRDLSKKHEDLKRRPSVAPGCELLQKEKQSQVMRRTSIVFIIVTIVFFCSYAPYFVTLILSMTDPTVEGSMGPKLKVIYDLCKLSPLFNNIANPIIYSFSSAGFRDELKKMVTLKTFAKGVFRRRAYSMGNKSVDFEISQGSFSN